MSCELPLGLGLVLGYMAASVATGGGGLWASGWLTWVGDCFVSLLMPCSVPSNQINVNLILVVSLGSAHAWHLVVLALVQHLHSFCSLYLGCESGVCWRFMGWGGPPGLHLLWWDFGSTDIDNQTYSALWGYPKGSSLVVGCAIPSPALAGEVSVLSLFCCTEDNASAVS